MPMLVCHIGWMNLYEGLDGKLDSIVGGGSYVRKHKRGAEICNFVRCSDGYVYGFVETSKDEQDRSININLLGANNDADYIDGIDVLWTAGHPTQQGRRVVGWYRNARVFRHRQRASTYRSPQHRLDGLREFHVRARTSDVTLIPFNERTLKLGRGKGWIGHNLWWFPEKSKNAQVKKFLVRLYRRMNSIGAGGTTKPMRSMKGKWGGNSDPERKAAVEIAATTLVKKYYVGYRIKSVEDENLGWDLEALKRGNEPLCLEVKGLHGTTLQVGLTPREYCALASHIEGEMDNYRLCVVTEALSKDPKLAIFRHTQGGWMNEYSGRPISPTITPVEAAIVSLTSSS